VVTGTVPRRKSPLLWNRNQKYSVITFIPLVLFNQFKFFLNLFFLIMACSQFIPVLRSAVDILDNQCCGTGSVGNVTFCRSGTGTVKNLLKFRARIYRPAFS
jgi:magnesium-transporting ATPase (P-type)